LATGDPGRGISQGLIPVLVSAGDPVGLVDELLPASSEPHLLHGLQGRAGRILLIAPSFGPFH
jgi:hypothetical protein